jgi:hypothetical protein
MFADERLESYFTGLGGVAEEYGLNHWGRLKNETDQSRLEDYPGLTADEAQQVRFAVWARSKEEVITVLESSLGTATNTSYQVVW